MHPHAGQAPPKTEQAFSHVAAGSMCNTSHVSALRSLTSQPYSLALASPSVRRSTAMIRARGRCRTSRTPTPLRATPPTACSSASSRARASTTRRSARTPTATWGRQRRRCSTSRTSSTQTGRSQPGKHGRLPATVRAGLLLTHRGGGVAGLRRPSRAGRGTAPASRAQASPSSSLSACTSARSKLMNPMLAPAFAAATTDG